MTYAQRMPGGLDVSFDPLLDMLDILGAIRQIPMDILRIAVQEIDTRLLARLERYRPTAMLGS
jgi:hypothetical protein